ncbi:MAG: NTP transferase domain-containing protein [Ruminococcus sp.]|nr:NTP transferase domain-containing protein [Ruminococcus sp.]
MKNIEMPACLLNKSSLMNSFRSSGKKHLIITGGRGSGKSTLINSLAGVDISTRAEKGKAVYLYDKASGKETVIGVFRPESEGQENRMAVCAEGFLGTGISALRRCAESESEFAVIDEIGYLDAQCSEYCDELRNLFGSRRVIAVVRKQEIPFLKELTEREDVFVTDLDRPFGNAGLVIMASGEGKRFGGNKLIADFKGKPLITHILKASENIFAKRVVVTRHESVARICRENSVEVIVHDQPYRSDTIRIGIQFMSDTDSCVFCPADQPLLSAETLQSLAVSAASQKAYCIRPKYDETAGAPVAFPEKLYNELMTLPQGKGGNHIIKKHPEMLKYISIRNAYELMDIDTREDILRLQEYGC